MELVPFKRIHFESFLLAGAAEGWITDRAEMEFLLTAYPAGCLVSLAAGKPAAFITAIQYGRSAWIGNLLVLPAFRQQGIGRALMEKVLHRLELSGAETVWLTASADGAHLYRTLGFKQVDRVQRWRGAGRGPTKGSTAGYTAAVACIDSQGWGDSRRLIFAALPTDACFLSVEDAFLLQTATAAGLHIGPWGATSEPAAAFVLETALSGEGKVTEMFLDSPEKNHAAGELLAAKGFSVCGTVLLMYKGKEPEYRPEYIYSLASMGSYG